MSLEITLGPNKIAKINDFKGKKLLDLRNYFEKDGETKPTQKGISLTAEQWQALIGRKDQISRALGVEVFDEDNSIELGKRKPSQKASPKPKQAKQAEPAEPAEPEARAKPAKPASRVKSEEYVSEQDKAL